MKENSKWLIGTIIAGVCLLNAISAPIVGYVVSQSNDKINRIAVASIKNDERLERDIKELRKHTSDNRQRIAKLEASYQADMKWIIKALGNIENHLEGE